MRKRDSGGGWQAVAYTWKKSREAGGFWKFWKAMRSRNACKTCALGMGGQKGGMVNEAGNFPEVCKKSLQAMAADMQGAIAPEFWRKYTVQQLATFTPRELEHCGRLTQPLIHLRGSRHYEPISWDMALDRIAKKLRDTPPDRSFWYFSGRSSNEAGFLLQLFARLYGTNNVNNCSFFCHQASGVGLTSAIGSGTATVDLDDLHKADLLFLIGGNPASNHPRLMTSLMELRRRGGKVIVINPVREIGLVKFRIPSDVRSMLFGSEIASSYLQPHIGGDLALLSGIAKHLDEIQAQDKPFLQANCLDSEEWLAHLRQMPWDEIVSKSGVSRADIATTAETYRQSKNTVFAWTMGITHHLHGVDNVQAITNLALMRGMVGRRSAGLMPLRGHSNVQGLGSVGVTPKLRDAIFAQLSHEYGLKLPTTPGLDTLACIEGSHRRELSSGFCLGGNLFGSSPDSTFAAEALGRLDQLVHLNTTLNTGHAQALAEETILLPVLARDEEPQRTTQESMFNFVRISDGGPARHAGPRSEMEVIAELAKRILGEQGGGLDWTQLRQASAVRDMIAKTVPGYGAIAQVDATGTEFPVAGRVLHEPKFPTPSGKAKLFRHTLPENALDADQLRLMTVRSEGQFNSVVYEEYDLYRHQDRRDVILLHPDDISRLGLKPEQRVSISSSVGKMNQILVRSFDEIRPGNALMYYPECNVLVPRDVDPQSRTPAFKNVAVRVGV